MPFTNWTPSQVIDWLSSLDPTFRKTYGSTILERQFDGENIAVVTHQALKNDLELKSSDEMIIWAALENLRKSKVTTITIGKRNYFSSSSKTIPANLIPSLILQH